MISTYSDFIFPLFAHSYPIHNTQGSQEFDTNLNFRLSVRFRISIFVGCRRGNFFVHIFLVSIYMRQAAPTELFPSAQLLYHLIHRRPLYYEQLENLLLHVSLARWLPHPSTSN